MNVSNSYISLAALHFTLDMANTTFRLEKLSVIESFLGARPLRDPSNTCRSLTPVSIACDTVSSASKDHSLSVSRGLRG